MRSYYAYIRVSTVKQGQSGVSLQEQRNAIERYAEREQLTISEWYEEQETAAKHGRTKFTVMMQQLRARKAAGVLIHKIDRSARNLRDWADLADLMDIGVEVRFVTESLDLSSRGGRLTADIQAVVAADYIRNLRDEARKGFYGRLKQGLYPLPAPLGYLDSGTGKPKDIDRKRGALVTDAFTLYATGEFSLERLRVNLTGRGLTNRGGAPISKSALSRMLNNPFYTGVIRIGTTGETFPGVHEPLVEAETFQAVQRILKGKTNTKIRQHRFTYQRLLKCVSCARILTGERQKGIAYYRCHNRACAGTSIRESALDTQVAIILSQVALTGSEVGLLQAAFEKSLAAPETDFDDERNALDLQERAITSRLDRLTDLVIDETITKDAHNQKRESLLLKQAQIDRRRAEIADTKAAHRLKTAELFELCKTAQHCRDFANHPEMRELLLQTCSNFSVDRKNVSIELFPAYQALANRPRVPSGGAYAVVFRTLARSLLGM